MICDISQGLRTFNNYVDYLHSPPFVFKFQEKLRSHSPPLLPLQYGMDVRVLTLSLCRQPLHDLIQVR